ncbi:hypothetical protein QBD01_000494 [Ochrobactrum sp. 19YEA23]|uniref:hypothetical protein n=1 Tax=Ochrobactrum sp. 19YEA23 TaxID=3039854 RepID=UPI002478CE66|nr:hypothetical protein [Ochrobactrum sp. 19YEA23]
MENKLKKYVSALIVAAMFSGAACAEETKGECAERVAKECTAEHGSDLLEFNADYHDCLSRKMPFCPGFGG